MSTTTVISSLTYDVYDNLGKNDFDLFELTEKERADDDELMLNVLRCHLTY